jgi:hypothetical protein
MHFLYNILLTKIFNLMKKSELRAKVLLFSLVFFFMGMATINAQYVSPEEAIVLLKGEIEDLEAQIPGATTGELLEINFQTLYFNAIVSDLVEGTEVDAAISNNQPTTKPGLNSAGNAVSFHSPNEEQEIEILVNYVENLLAD